MFIRELEFNNAKDFLNALVSWNNNLRTYIFRGHSKEEYKLLPNSLREDNLESLFKMASYNASNAKLEYTNYALMNYEHAALRNFYKSADMNGLSVPLASELRSNLALDWGSVINLSNAKNEIEWIPESLWEITALAQHYGLPTRFLDWTYDPFIATYFAARPSVKSEVGGKLNVWGLNKESIGILKMLSGKIFPLNFVTPHYSSNPNISAQKGLFTHLSTKIGFLGHVEQERKPLDEMLKTLLSEDFYKERDVFVKLTLPNSQACEAFRLLTNFGYGSARVFPGYDGVVKQLEDQVALRSKGNVN